MFAIYTEIIYTKKRSFWVEFIVEDEPEEKLKI